MTQKAKKVSVAYTKLLNGHGFQATDESTKWLLVTSSSLDEAIEEVSQQLSEILGGKWEPNEKAKHYLSLGNEVTNDNNIIGAAFSGYLGSCNWVPVAA